MCGIFGIVTSENKVLGPTLIDAGRRLSYRGYDSVGCASLHDDGTIDLRKDVGKIDEVASHLNFTDIYGKRGILQLRWATFGSPSQVNAQPHLDSDGDMVGAHNGNVVNNNELRAHFIAQGMQVRSTNDGETCVHAVEQYIDQGYEFVDAIRSAYHDLEGDYAFVIGRAYDDYLYAIKKGSSLVAGLGEGFTCVSSDLPSILPLTQKVVRINDGEIVILSAVGIEIRSVEAGERINRPFEIIKDSMEAVQKGGYPHFMLKEIHEQAIATGELLHLLDYSEQMESYLNKISSARNVYLIGCGTSYHACILGSVYLSQLANKAAIPVLAPQFIAQYADAVNHQDVGIFVSQSGETKDVLNALEAAQKRNMQVLSLVNVIGSTLMRASEAYLPLGCGYEISVPATKTYTNQVISFLYLAQKLGDRSDLTFDNLPHLIAKTIEAVDPKISEIAHVIKPRNDLYCLGYGLTYPVALEGALKLKEITYAHCEGMLSTEFKHGPLSAVSEGYPVIFIAGQQDIPLIVSGINEVTCRGGHAIAICEDDARLRSNAQDVVVIPNSNPYFNSILSVIPLQLLSYQMSIARGHDPDFPRNLSKTLTVD